MNERTQNLILGFGGGLAAAVAVPFLLPVVSAAARPLAKVLLKQSLLGLDRLRTAASHASESVEDLWAEVRAEVAAELEARHGTDHDAETTPESPELAARPAAHSTQLS